MRGTRLFSEMARIEDEQPQKRLTRAQSGLPTGKLSHDDDLSKALDRNAAELRKAGKQAASGGERLQSNARLPTRPSNPQSISTASRTEMPKTAALGKKLNFGGGAQENAGDVSGAGHAAARGDAEAAPRVRFVPARTPSATTGVGGRTRGRENLPSWAKPIPAGEDSISEDSDSTAEEMETTRARAANAREAKAREAAARDARAREAAARDAQAGEATAGDAKAKDAKARDARADRAKAKDAPASDAKARDARAKRAKAGGDSESRSSQTLSGAES